MTLACCDAQSNAATALFMAASNGYLSLVRYLVLEARANMEATDKVRTSQGGRGWLGG